MGEGAGVVGGGGGGAGGEAQIASFRVFSLSEDGQSPGPATGTCSLQPRLKSSGQWTPTLRVQELCESRGGRPGLSVLTSLMVSVDVKQY